MKNNAEFNYSIQQNDNVAVRMKNSYPDPRTNNVKIHYHSTIEIALIREGNGIYRTTDREYNIVSGDMFFFRPNEPHCVTDIAEPGMETISLHIAPYYLYTKFQDSLNSGYIKILSASFPLSSHKINDVLSAEAMLRMQEFFYMIQQEMAASGDDYPIFVNNCISSMLILLSRAYQKEGNTKSADKNVYRRVAKAIAYIDTNFRDDISLEDIAAHVGYTRCYFSTIFRRYMGMKPWDYISIKRIEEAIRLIKTTDSTILEIATSCGFNNTVNFCRLFKKYTNLLPSNFRS